MSYPRWWVRLVRELAARTTGYQGGGLVPGFGYPDVPADQVDQVDVGHGVGAVSVSMRNGKHRAVSAVALPPHQAERLGWYLIGAARNAQRLAREEPENESTATVSIGVGGTTWMPHRRTGPGRTGR